jgi:very-short-patch-repair endonuclease
LPVTTPERTLFDLAATTGVGQLAWMAVELARDGRLQFGAVERVVADIGRRGKPGTARMRELLESLDTGDQRSTGESPLERRGRALLTRASCACGFRSEFPIPWAKRRRFDDAFPTHRLAIEWDSIRYHGQRDAFEVDRRRDRSALEHGWRVVRFTWADVTERPDRVVDTVRRMLRCEP